MESGKRQRSAHSNLINGFGGTKGQQLSDDPIRNAAMTSKAWPYEEARKLLKRWPDGKPDAVVFETGYGPSGLPHIGTFNEVLRTTMVRHAYEELSARDGKYAPTRLIAFSDDMDGLRKVPDNVPQQEMLAEYLGMPLTKVPDPFGEYESFAHHNNAMLRRFLDRFGFDYEFASSTEYYASGRFDETIRQVLRKWDDVMGVMLPTLREERRQTYSPVLPLSPTTGKVLQVPVRVVDAETGVIAFTDDDGTGVEQSALGGKSKLQWKVDWALRWVALGVDYEMAGKDLIDSTIQSGKIARILGGRPPEGFNYEMFLDEKGEKISKSKGNGLGLEDWLTYGSEESLAFFAYREPKKAKSLHIGVIPRAVDEYYQFRGNYPGQPVEQQLGNPVHHIHGGKVPTGCAAADLWVAIEPRVAAWRRRQGHGLAVRPALCAWYVARNPSGTGQADPAGGQLCPRFRSAEPSPSRTHRARSGSIKGPRWGAGQAKSRHFRRRDPACRVRSRQAPPVRVAAALVPVAL
jgi:lysyl-tRNA synthetase class 1